MYCTLTDMINRFELTELIQLSDSAHIGMIDDAVVNAAISDASNLIDGYISGRYALPLQSVPSVLISICANIARYNMYDNAVTDVVQRNYDAAIRFLEQVGTGKIKMGLSADNTQPESDQTISIESSESVFARSRAKGFI